MRWRDWWHQFLVYLGLQTDWTDADNAPPAFPDVPHAYAAHPELACCKRCGGGFHNPIHRGVKMAVPRVEMSEESKRKWDDAPKDQ